MNASDISPRSEHIVETLLPQVREIFRDLWVALNEHFANKGIRVEFISGNRTWKEQDALYAQGRTASGKIVTNARGGYSNHNFGLAVDIGLFHGSDYLEESPFYAEIGRVVAQFKSLEWGGNWKSIQDEPHVQYATGLTLAEMRERVENGERIV
jgi:peptidoglycan L-alanyl-D-glutamate endopeptidase CwlK